VASLLPSCKLTARVLVAGEQLIDAAAESLGDRTAPLASSKRRKGGATADGAAAEGALEERPQAELAGHLQCVSAVEWREDDTLFSASWDHSVSRHSLVGSPSTSEGAFQQTDASACRCNSG
jgi:hypothetical protein